MNLMYFETSSKTGSNVKGMFNEVAKKLTGVETLAGGAAEAEKTTGGC